MIGVTSLHSCVGRAHPHALQDFMDWLKGFASSIKVPRTYHSEALLQASSSSKPSAGGRPNQSQCLLCRLTFSADHQHCRF